MKIRAFFGAGITIAALAATQLNAAAFTSGVSLPTGTGSSVLVTGVVTPPSPTAALDAEAVCLQDFINSIGPPPPPPPPPQASVSLVVLGCMVRGLGLSSTPGVSAGGTWAGVTRGGSFTATLSCQASATVGLLTVDEPVTTTVSACYLLGKTDGLAYAVQTPFTLPGATSAVNAVALNLPIQNYAVCVAGDAHYLNGTTPSTGGTGCF